MQQQKSLGTKKVKNRRKNLLRWWRRCSLHLKGYGNSSARRIREKIVDTD